MIFFLIQAVAHIYNHFGDLRALCYERNGLSASIRIQFYTMVYQNRGFLDFWSYLGEHCFVIEQGERIHYRSTDYSCAAGTIRRNIIKLCPDQKSQTIS